MPSKGRTQRWQALLKLEAGLMQLVRRLLLGTFLLVSPLLLVFALLRFLSVQVMIIRNVANMLSRIKLLGTEKKDKSKTVAATKLHTQNGSKATNSAWKKYNKQLKKSHRSGNYKNADSAYWKYAATVLQ